MHCNKRYCPNLNIMKRGKHNMQIRFDHQHITYPFTKKPFVNFLRVQDTMSIVVNKFFLLLSAWISQIPHWSQCSFSQLLKILSKNLVVSYCEYNPFLLGGRMCVKGYNAIDTYSLWEIMTLTPSQLESAHYSRKCILHDFQEQRMSYMHMICLKDHPKQIGMVCHCAHTKAQ